MGVETERERENVADSQPNYAIFPHAAAAERRRAVNDLADVVLRN